MNNKNNILTEHLQELINANIITPQIAQNILAFYEQKQLTPPATAPAHQTRRSDYTIALGILFITLGFLFLVAYNLNSLSNLTKLILSIIVLTFTSVAAFIATFKIKKPILKEGILAVHSLMIGGTLALVQQTFTLYQANNHLYTIWLALLLPLVYICKRFMPAVIYNLVTFFWLASGEMQAYIYLIIPIILLVLPFAYRMYRVHHIYYKFLWWQIALNLFVGLLSVYNYYVSIFLLPAAAFICLLSFNLGVQLRRYNLYSEPLRYIGYIGANIVLLLLTNSSFLQISIFSRTPVVSDWLFLLALTVANIVLSYLNFKDTPPSSRQTLLALLPVTLFIISVGSYLDIAKTYLSYLLSAHLLFLAVATIWQAFNDNSKMYLNLGLAGLILVVLFKVFDMNISFLTQGFIFIALGSIFIAANYFFNRKKRGELQ